MLARVGGVLGVWKSNFHAKGIFKTPWDLGTKSKREVDFGHGFESSYGLENLTAVFLIFHQEFRLNWNTYLALR